MIKITLSILITVFLLATGCSTSPPPPPRATEFEPLPQEPTHTISINIDSIPSGADVYTIELDGQLGSKIGTTPFIHTCGVAEKYEVYKDTKERISRSVTYAWGAGCHWDRNDSITTTGEFSTIGYYPSSNLVLQIALAKGDHSIAVASKKLHTANLKLKNKTIALTVPLKTLEQVNQEVELYLRQQELANARNNNVQSPSQNQNITIRQKKDGLDSVNSGLDALIKMQALGAFNR